MTKTTERTILLADCQSFYASVEKASYGKKFRSVYSRTARFFWNVIVYGKPNMAYHIILNESM
ncbi:hypothetical protein NST83_15010 [Paenibacillus sp. FSL R10-2782]|uniref:hypothetical protein n=1 Tax=Paenibacillus sp. FSL R10-2782 TaxID=2954661 RepID=UPI00315853A9